MDFLSNEEDGGDEDGQRLLLIFSMNQPQQQIQAMPPHQLPVPGDVHRPNMANDPPQPMTDVAASNPYFHFSDHPQQGLNSAAAPAAETMKTTTTHHLQLPHSLSTPPPPNNEHIKGCAGRRVGSAEPTSAGNVHSEPAVSSSSSSFACCRGCGLEIRDRHLLCLNGRRRQNVADPTIMASEVDGNNNDNSSHEEQPSSMLAGGHVKEEEEEEQEDCWHELCLRCTHCGLQLGPATGSCFVRHGRVYCREDHAKLFGRSPQCSRCAIPIGAHELVFRSAGGHVYHAQCFQCCCCGQPLAKGDQYLNVDGQLVCQRDFGLWQLQQLSAAGHHKFGLPPPPGIVLGPTDQSPAGGPRFLPLPHFPELDFSLVHHQRPNFSHHHLHHHHGERSKKVPKRPRTILNAPQRKAFKLAFEKGPKPSRKVREQLARETGLSVRVVQVWFQNQRAKMKKERKREMDKQQQQQPNGNNGSSLGGGPASNGGTDSDGGGGGGGCFKEGDMDSQLFGSCSLRSPQSGSTGGKSEMLADDESDMDPEDGEEEEEGEEDESLPTSCNSSGLVMAAAGLAAAQMPNGIGGGMCPPQMMDANGMSLVGGQQQQQNPIEKLYNMHQTYFAFV